MIKETWNYTWSEYAAKLLLEANMEYNSTIFFLFLLIFLCVYFVIRNKTLKRTWILTGNVIFYLYSGWCAFIIVLATSGIVYWAVKKMDSVYAGFELEKGTLSPKEQVSVLTNYKKRAKKYLIAGMLLIVAVWIYVKIGRLLGLMSVNSFTDLLQGKGIIVPLGISYYTLSMMGYMLDVYWRKVKAEHSFFCFFLVVTYFPHIVQGPISKYNILVKRFNELPAFDYTRVCAGLQLMLWGYIKKMVIADRLVIFTTTVFDKPESFAGVEIFLAVALSVAQLYADFSGCMDIVRGISQTIGIELAENFQRPFFAKNAQEFWTRWHITLGAWTKDYIYLPIAMNPKFVKFNSKLKKKDKWLSSFLKAFCPLIAVWLFTGLWHGTGVDYITWGLYWCILMTLSKECKPCIDKLVSILKINKNRVYFCVLQFVRTYLIFAIGRMFTVAGSLAGCAMLWKRMFYEARLWTLFDGSLYTYGLDRKDFYVAFLGIILIVFIDYLHEHGVAIRDRIGKQNTVIRWGIYYAAIFSVIILGIYGPGFDASSFVYGAF